MGQDEHGVVAEMDAARIDDEVAEFIKILQADSARYPELATASFARRREIAEIVRKRWRSGGPEMARREDLHFDGPGGRIDLRLLVPLESGVPLPALLYVHGGGFTSFSLDTHDRLMREYAAGYGGAVVGVEYSLSPEAKFPVALDEVTAAVDWVAANAPRLGIDPDRLSIGGDSAGANLALSTCIRLRDRGDGGRIKAMVLNYGFFGPDTDTESGHRHGGEGKLLTRGELQAYVDNYLGGTGHGSNPLAWPLLADLHDLPPSFHAIAECDPLADVDRAMVARLKNAGNNVAHIVYRGATHSFLEGVAISSIARQAFADQSRWLADRLGHPLPVATTAPDGTAAARLNVR